MHDTRQAILYCTDYGRMKLTRDPRALTSDDTAIANGETWYLLRIMQTGAADGTGTYYVPRFLDLDLAGREAAALRFLQEAELMVRSGDTAPPGARLHGAALLLLAGLACRPALALDATEAQPEALPGARAMLAACETVASSDGRAGEADRAACMQRILPSLTSRQIEALGRAGYFGAWAEQLAAERQP